MTCQLSKSFSRLNHDIMKCQLNKGISQVNHGIMSCQLGQRFTASCLITVLDGMLQLR
jgi:hypothetical protein